MAIATSSGRARLLSFALAESWRSVAYRFHGSVLYRFRYAGRMPERLLIAPTDLRTSDPIVAEDIYNGRFLFAGEAIDTGGRTVFMIDPPSEEWSRRLHGFGWLRHLRAADLATSREQARTLVGDWIRLQGRHDPPAWEGEVIARRVFSWLSQSPLILEGCDYPFYWRFMRSLTAQVRHLRRVAVDAPRGLPRLRIMVTLAAASLAMADRERFIRQSGRWLDIELDRQILPDGGHVGRNPGAVLDILADLLPLRQAYSARGIQPSRKLIAAIDRMMPMLRFFRHGDGSFARFNGMGDTPSDLVATVLAYDDARGRPVMNAPHSGYQRLVAGPTALLVDTGAPPPIAYSTAAHAGCLAFELSVGRQLLVINCGVPQPGAGRLRQLARSTAAHSTAIFNDTSSCRFLEPHGIREGLGAVVVSGPNAVSVERGQDEGGQFVRAQHDGYAERFGVIHERRLTLSPSGDSVDGTDAFLTRHGRPLGRSGRDRFAIRFHLHPSISASPAEDGRSIDLFLPDGEIWAFESPDLDPAIEPSLLLSDVRGNRPASQVVLHGGGEAAASVAWSIRRVGYRGSVRIREDERPPPRPRE